MILSHPDVLVNISCERINAKLIHINILPQSSRDLPILSSLKSSALQYFRHAQLRATPDTAC